MCFAIKNEIEIIQAATSATVIANQIPSTPKIIGNTNTDDVWNKSVLKNEIAAETAPLLSPVKNDDVKILKPEKIKDNENSLKAR